MKLKYSILKLQTDYPVKEDASKLRGFIGNMFKEYPELHHHIEEEKYVYYYPIIQYKIIDEKPYILGINQGTEILKKILGKVNFLCLGNNTYKVVSKELIEKEERFTYIKGILKYNFLTPWLALNQENFLVYKEFLSKRDFVGLKKHLNSILSGNILSMSKSLNFVVDKELVVFSKLEGKRVFYKGVSMIGFLGEFKTNFYIPDYFGVGKGVSQGYGIVKKVDFDKLDINFDNKQNNDL